MARLKAGERERAEKLLAGGVEPIVPEAVDRWVIFLSESEVVFLFEAEVRASRFWRPLTTQSCRPPSRPGFRSSTARSIGRTRRVHGSVELPPTVPAARLTR